MEERERIYMEKLEGKNQKMGRKKGQRKMYRRRISAASGKKEWKRGGEGEKQEERERKEKGG